MVDLRTSKVKVEMLLLCGENLTEMFCNACRRDKCRPYNHMAFLYIKSISMVNHLCAHMAS